MLPNGLLDTLELVALGRHWQWGYWNHPPLAAWIAGAGVTLSGGALWGVYLTGQIAVLASFWAVWRLGVETVGPSAAVLGVLLLEGVRFYGYDTPGFSRNVVQLPLAALTALYLWRALDAGRMRWWIAAGATAGLGLLNKYDMALLVAPVVVLLALHPEARRRAGLVGPGLAAAVAALVWAPHVAWLWRYGFPTLDYVASRTTPKTVVEPGFAHLVHPLSFALSQALVVAPVLLLMATLVIGSPRRREVAADALARPFLLAITFGPCLLYLVGSALTGAALTLQWGTPLWSFLGVYLLDRWRPAPSDRAVRRFAGILVALAVLWVAAFVAQLTLVPALGGHLSRGLFPGRAIAQHVTTGWRQAVGMTALPIVASEKWLTWNVAVYSPDRPDPYMDLDPRRSPWTSDDDLRRRGGVLIWDPGADSEGLPASWAARFPMAVVQPPASFPRHAPASSPPIRLGWAILPPASALPAASPAPPARP